MAHMVNCIKLGREAEGLDYPPLPRPGHEDLQQCFPKKLGNSGSIFRP